MNEPLQDLLDQNLAQHYQMKAELIVLRETLANLMSGGDDELRATMLAQMEKAAAFQMQIWMEKMESDNPELAARLDKHREPFLDDQ